LLKTAPPSIGAFQNEHYLNNIVTEFLNSKKDRRVLWKREDNGKPELHLYWQPLGLPSGLGIFGDFLISAQTTAEALF
jgi:hypothetical protein